MIMRSQVSGFKPMSEGRVMKISSDSAEFSAKTHSVAFKNNVVIKVDKMVVRGNLATFQYKDGKLYTLYMKGGIHMLDVDKSGSSGEAIVYFNEDKYIFREKPFITQGENALIGDEIIVYNGGKQVEVKNAKVEYYQYNNQPPPEQQKPVPAPGTKK
jgi:lipopolysaccharide export system protein LptA